MNFEDAIKKLMENDKNGTWDEIEKGDMDELQASLEVAICNAEGDEGAYAFYYNILDELDLIDEYHRRDCEEGF